MRSTQILTLASILATTVSAGNIGFGITTDSCGDGFYVGCFAQPGECCNLPSNYEAQSVSFSIGPNFGTAYGRAFNKAGCNIADRVVERPSNNQAEFCMSNVARYDVTSAHFEYSGAGKKRAVGGGSVKRAGNGGEKACRSVDHLVFPGGARADIQGLEERELCEVIDLIVARGDVAAVETKLAGFRK